MSSSERQRARVLVAGAGGAIGTAVCRDLAADHEVIALVGSDLRVQSEEADPAITWRACEPFSRREVEAAIAGCDSIVYLVHTRVPTARLDQAASEDMDLLVADNVARAASRHGVKQIVYLGGLIPEGNVAPQVIERRREVAEALSFYGTPVTALRAGLVVAPGGSAVGLLATAATRLPVVLLPKWALTRKQPIALSDVVRGIRFCLGNESLYGQCFEVGGPVVLDVREMLQRAAEVLRKKQVVVTVPFFPSRLYEWYLRLLDRRAHPALVRVVVENLRHDMLARDNPVQRFIANAAVRPGELIEEQVRELKGRLPDNPREPFSERYLASLRKRRSVRSIQRIVLPKGRDAAWGAGEYFRWLPRFAWPFVRCEVDASGSCRIESRFPRLRLLELTLEPVHSSPDRRLYFITGGLLARGQSEGKPRFEFRHVLNGRYMIVAIHDFAPQLPWGFYRATQAVVHLVVMRSFQRYMARIAS